MTVLLGAQDGPAAGYPNVDVCEVASQQSGEGHKQDVPAHFKLTVEQADVCDLLPGNVRARTPLLSSWHRQRCNNAQAPSRALQPIMNN